MRDRAPGKRSLGGSGTLHRARWGKTDDPSPSLIMTRHKMTRIDHISHFHNISALFDEIVVRFVLWPLARLDCFDEIIVTFVLWPIDAFGALTK